MRIFALLLTVVYFLSCTDSSPITGGVDDAGNFLSGTVVYQNGEIASNEEITLQKVLLDTNGYTIDYTNTTTTTNEGYYEFRDIPNGNFQVITKSKMGNNRVAMKQGLSFKDNTSRIMLPLMYGNGHTVYGKVINSAGVKVVLPGLGERILMLQEMFYFDNIGNGAHDLGIIKTGHMTFFEFDIKESDKDSINLGTFEVLPEMIIHTTSIVKDTTIIIEKLNENDSIVFIEKTIFDTISIIDTLRESVGDSNSQNNGYKKGKIE